MYIPVVARFSRKNPVLLKKPNLKAPVTKRMKKNATSPETKEGKTAREAIRNREARKAKARQAQEAPVGDIGRTRKKAGGEKIGSRLKRTGKEGGDQFPMSQGNLKGFFLKQFFITKKFFYIDKKKLKFFYFLGGIAKASKKIPLKTPKMTKIKWISRRRQ